MTISKIYKGTAELTNVLKIYKGSELVYEKEEEPSYPNLMSSFSKAIALEHYRSLRKVE